MQKTIRKFIGVFFVALLSCNKDDNKIEPERVYALVEKYNPAEEAACYKAQKRYLLKDSLDTVMNKIYSSQKYMDTNFRKPVLFLMEKKFLFISKYTGEKEPFYVSNAAAWAFNDSYIFTASKFFLSGHGSDTVCIRSIILESSKYHLKNQQHQRVHDSCLLLIPNKCEEI
jgi:hypothetical protein